MKCWEVRLGVESEPASIPGCLAVVFQARSEEEVALLEALERVCRDFQEEDAFPSRGV
jgi:hypothetical protein